MPLTFPPQALSRYPTITVKIIHNDKCQEVALRKRSLKTLLGLASGTFRKQMSVCELQPSNSELINDDDLRSLIDGDSIMVR